MVDIINRYSGEVIISGSTISRAIWEARQTSVSIRFADLSYKILHDVNFEGMDLRNVDLEMTCLCGSNLADVDLRDATLRGVNFLRTNMSRVILEGVDMSKVGRFRNLWVGEDGRCGCDLRTGGSR